MTCTTRTCLTLSLVLAAGTASAQVVPPTPAQDFGAITKSDFLEPDGFFSIDTCGSDFDTEIGFWDRRGQLNASNDDADKGPCVGSLQSFASFRFPPGVYYFSVSGFDTIFGDDFVAATDEFSAGGDVVAQLNVEDGLETFDITDTIQAGDGIAVNGGVKYYRFIVPGVFEATDLGTVSTDGFVSINTNSSDFDTELGVWNLDTGELIDSDDDGGDGTRSALDLRLPTGRYAMSVSGFNTFFRDGFTADTAFDADSGNAAGDINGVAFADVVSEGGEAEWYTFDVLALPAGALAEGEADCGTGFTDTNNCFANGTPTPLALGQTVVGTFGGGNGTPDDRDYYEIVITETTQYTLSLEAEAGTAFGFASQTVPGVAGCDNLEQSIGGRIAQAFDPDGFSGTLEPGTYYAVVSTAFGGGPSPCGSGYALTFRPQIPDCPAGSIQESEPVPFDDFLALGGSTNNACNTGGGDFVDISLGDTVCGATGTHAEGPGNFGDQDAYRFSLSAPTVVEYQLISTAGIRGITTTTPLGSDPCPIFNAGGPVFDAEPGTTGSIRLALEAGEHSVNVLANPFAEAGVASGTPYILTSGEYTCRADVNLDGFVTPADFNAWVLAFNSQSVTCDQNGNGVCEPGDFNAWVLNFNTRAGCDN
ncbi:MAG: hypothetical protein AAF937_13115 [Planctomycetota bacterium]